jgi:4-hydroxyphenylacetate 3-monooxygenase
MLRSANEYLESIRDGRVIFVADERVEDATTPPAFRNGARTYAALYGMDPSSPHRHRGARLEVSSTSQQRRSPR